MTCFRCLPLIWGALCRQRMFQCLRPSLSFCSSGGQGRYFFSYLDFMFFFSMNICCFLPPAPAPPSPNVLLSLYRQPACCDLWVSAAQGSQTGKFPVYTRIPWKMSLVNLFLSLTSLNCETIFLKPSILAFTNTEKQIGSLFCFHSAQNCTLTSCGQVCVIETYFWNLFKEERVFFSPEGVEVLSPNVNAAVPLIWVNSLLYPACGVAAHWFCGRRVQALR